MTTQTIYRCSDKDIRRALTYCEHEFVSDSVSLHMLAEGLAYGLYMDDHNVKPVIEWLDSNSFWSILRDLYLDACSRVLDPVSVQWSRP